MFQRIIIAAYLLVSFNSFGSAIDLPLPVAHIERTEPVSFSKEIMPLLQRSCLACHHAKEPEGGIVLETHALILKGGDSGPGLVAGKSAESALFLRSTGQEDPLMPPEDNSVGAKPLSADELGLLKRWIDEGAKADAPVAPAKIAWQPLPETFRPVYALALSPDDQYVAFGQGNRASVIHLPSWTNVGQLIDPSLNKESVSGIAHLDIVQSIAFAPDSSRIATGGYKTVKIWRRVAKPQTLAESPIAKTSGPISVSGDDSRYAIIVGENIELYERATNKQQAVIKHELPDVASLAWSADGLWIVAEAADGHLRIWQTDNQSLVADQTSLPVLTKVAASAKGKWLVGVTAEQKIVAWSLDAVADQPTPLAMNKKEHAALQALVGVNAIGVVATDAPRVVIAGEDGKSHVADPISGKIDRTIDHGKPVKSLSISHDQLRLATGAADGTIKVWLIASGEQKLFLERDAKTTLAIAAANGDVSRQQATIQRLTAKVGDLEKAIIKETEAKTKAEEAKKKAAEEATKKAAEVAAAKKAMTDHEQAIKDAEVAKQQAEKAVVDLAKKIETMVAQREAKQKAIEQAETNQNKAKEEVQKHEQAVAAVVDAEKRAKQAVIDQQTAIKSEQENLTKLQTVVKEVKPSAEFVLPVTSIAFAPDNQTLVAVRNDKLWIHRDEGKTIEPQLPSGAKPIAELAITPEQQLLTIAQGAAPTVWPMESNWELERTIGSAETDVLSDRVSMLRFSPDGSQLLVGSGPPSRFGDLKLFAVGDGKLTRDFGEVHSDTIFAAAYSPNGREIATGGADKTVRTFNPQTGERIRSFEGHTHHVLGVAWRDDCQSIASAGADQTVKIWDAESGETRRTISGFPKEVTAIDFVGTSADVVTAGSDGQVRLYDTNNGSNKRSFNGAKDALFAVSVTRDGKTILAGGQEGILFRWELETGKLIQQTK